jgi:hypothetical protein
MGALLVGVHVVPAAARKAPLFADGYTEDTRFGPRKKELFVKILFLI